MARHKTAHRKRLEQHNRDVQAARAELLADASNDLSLKANAQANAKRYAKPVKASKS